MHIIAIRRLLTAIPVLFGVSLIVFSMIHLIPGDPIDIIAGEMLLPQEAREDLRRQLGLDQPLLDQYVSWLSDALRGDLGRSIRTNRSVSEEIMTHLPQTLILAVAAAVIAAVMGFSLGIVAALNFRKWPDSFARIFSLIGVALPNFWLGILLILLFSVTLQVLPIGGQGTPAHLILPAVTLGVAMAAVTARIVRSSLLDTLGADYVRTARSKGLPRRSVVTRHALRNALMPAVTIIGLQLGYLLSGTMIVETVFSRQGLGRLTVQAVLNRDYPMVQGTILVSATIYVLVNLVVDISYLYLDPRTRRT